MNTSKNYLIIEFLLLFVAIPLFLAWNITEEPTGLIMYIKLATVLIGFVYLLVMLRRLGTIKFKIEKGIQWSLFWKRIGMTFIGILVFTIPYVWMVDKQALFYIPINKPLLWIGILFVYSLFSVWPQEVIYRTFFFERYRVIFPKKAQIVFINAVVFMMAHLFFRSTLVLVLTFIGGIIFGLTYLKVKSTTLVSIEHAIYGNWLFTVGMGEMLKFPGMEAGV